MDIALIGLGQMGLAYAQRLAQTGHRVLGYDLSERAMDALVASGGTAAPSISMIGGQETTVLLSLPDVAVVERVVDELLEGTGGRALHGVVDLSTTGPVGAKRVARTLAARGVAYAEAPVTGGVSGAASGSLTLMAAGDPHLLATAKPVLDALGTVVLLGDGPGLGQTMKVLNNLLSATSLAITSEAMAAGVKAGLDPDQMLAVFNNGSGKNAATMDKFPKYVMTGTFDQGFAAALMAKDVRLAQELLHSVSMPAWVAAAVVETWLATVQQLPDGADFTEIARVHASYLSPDARTGTSIYEEPKK